MRLRTAILLLILIAAGCDQTNPERTDGPSPPPTTAGATTNLTIDGILVSNGAAFLGLMENDSRWRNRDGYRCYFSSFDDVELNPFVRCGPVPPSRKGEQGPWETYGIGAEIDAAGSQLIQFSNHGVGYRLLENEALSRPDGLRAPSPDEISVPAVTGRVFETLWDTLDYDFHYCMAETGSYAFDALFTFDGKDRLDLEEGELVEAVLLLVYEPASFAGEIHAEDAARCVDEVARRAGASSGELAE